MVFSPISHTWQNPRWVAQPLWGLRNRTGIWPPSADLRRSAPAWGFLRHLRKGTACRAQPPHNRQGEYAPATDKDRFGGHPMSETPLAGLLQHTHSPGPTRIAVIFSVLLIYLYCFSWLSGDRDVIIPVWALAGMVALPFAGAYLFSLWPSRRTSGSFKLGFLTGIGLGTALLGAVASVLSWTDAHDPAKRWALAACLGLFIAAQVAVMGIAVRFFKAFANAAREKGRLIIGAIVAVAYCFVVCVPFDFTVFLMAWPDTRQIVNESTARDSLRSLNVALITYAIQKPGGCFAPSLEKLGPRGANLIDEKLASGKKDRYVFTYTAGPTDRSGCISAYTIHARPAKYGEAGYRSFLTDAEGVIRATPRLENRPATRQDPPEE